MIRTLSRLIILSSICLLFSPIVLLKVVPNSLGEFDSSIPDIRIYGAYITGKDRSFWGINFAYKFQAITILCFSYFTFLISKESVSLKKKVTLGSINLFLLFLFPYWMKQYIEGVRGNSDGVTLELILQFGIYLYASISLFSIALFVALLNSRKKIKR